MPAASRYLCTGTQKALDSSPYPAYSPSADGTSRVHLVYHPSG
jgi:hypothetical protein